MVSKKLFLTIFLLILIISTLTAPISIYLAGTYINERSDISTYSLDIVLAVLASAIVFLSIAKTQNFTKKDNLRLILPIVIFIFAFSLSFMLEGERPSTLRIIAMLFIFLAAYIVINKITKNHSSIINVTFVILSLTALYLSYYFSSQNMVVYWPSPIAGILRPQIGQLMQSTEMSNILAIIILFGINSTYKNKSTVSKLVLVLLNILILILFIIMSSLGSIIMLALAYVFFQPIRLRAILHVSAAAMIIVSIAIGLVAINENDGLTFQDISQNINNKLETDERNTQYSDLINLIKDNPVFGAGIGTYTKKTGLYPHHNIMGMWTDHGLITMLSYVYILVLTFICSLQIRKIKMKYETNASEIKLATLFSMICIFLHGKGLVHDTWQGYELWFYTGCLFGIVKYLRNRPYTIPLKPD